MCCIALRYFVSGESFGSLEYQFWISRKTISYIVEQVAAVIIKILGEAHLKTLNTTDEWGKISQKLKKVGIFQMDWDVEMASILCYNSQKGLVRIFEIIGNQ